MTIFLPIFILLGVRMKQPDVNVISFISTSLTVGQNKLDSLSQETFIICE